MSSAIRPLLFAWIALLGLLAIEAIGGRWLGFGLPTLGIGAAMAAVVAVCFMHVGEGPAPVRLFAYFGVFWLAVLLGLGMTDPLTRTNHMVGGIYMR